MSVVSHLDMFYDTRWSMHIDKSDPSSSPNTELNSVPTNAKIEFDDSTTRFIDAEETEAPNGKGFETARWFIGRAMLDADAKVIPQ